MPYQHLRFFDVWMFVLLFAGGYFLTSWNVSVSVRLVRNELWICVTWSFKIKPAVPVSLMFFGLITNLRDERMKWKRSDTKNSTTSKRSQTFLLCVCVAIGGGFVFRISCVFNFASQNISYLVGSLNKWAEYSDALGLKKPRGQSQLSAFLRLTSFFFFFVVQSLHFLSAHCKQ